MNTLVLKILAVIFMITDHIGAVFFPNAAIFRLVGRLSYPLFAFCIAQGLIHTRSKAKYSLRLFLFAVISQIPYFLAFDKKPFDKLNVLFTFSAQRCLFTRERYFLVNKQKIYPHPPELDKSFFYFLYALLIQNVLQFIKRQ